MYVVARSIFHIYRIHAALRLPTRQAYLARLPPQPPRENDVLPALHVRYRILWHTAAATVHQCPLCCRRPAAQDKLGVGTEASRQEPTALQHAPASRLAHDGGLTDIHRTSASAQRMKLPWPVPSGNKRVGMPPGCAMKMGNYGMVIGGHFWKASSATRKLSSHKNPLSPSTVAPTPARPPLSAVALTQPAACLPMPFCCSVRLGFLHIRIIVQSAAQAAPPRTHVMLERHSNLGKVYRCDPTCREGTGIPYGRH